MRATPIPNPDPHPDPNPNPNPDPNPDPNPNPNRDPDLPAQGSQELHEGEGEELHGAPPRLLDCLVAQLDGSRILVGDLRGGLHLVVEERAQQRALRLQRERAVPTRRA